MKDFLSHCLWKLEEYSREEVNCLWTKIQGKKLKVNIDKTKMIIQRVRFVWMVKRVNFFFFQFLESDLSEDRGVGAGASGRVMRGSHVRGSLRRGEHMSVAEFQYSPTWPGVPRGDRSCTTHQRVPVTRLSYEAGLACDAHRGGSEISKLAIWSKKNI